MRRNWPLLKQLSNARGIALLVTLAVIAVLIPATLELNRHVRSTTTEAAAARDRSVLFSMAESGVQAAMALLAADRAESDADSLAEDWADPEKTSLLAAALDFDQGKLTIHISDEKSRIQVNALVDFPAGRDFVEPQRLVWERFLQGLIASSDLYADLDVPMVINSVKDWLDSGDDDAITGLSGAESDYYQSLPAPYPCRNGPIPVLDEMANIRGLDRSLLYGDGASPAIADFVTPQGISADAGNELVYDGRININTASLPVLAAMLPEESADLAESIMEYRQAAVEDDAVDLFSESQWYQNAPGCGELNIDPSLLTVSSDLFRVEATAEMADRKVTLRAIVKRFQETESGRWQARILQQEIE